jgi:hypothetical protein
MWVVFAVFSMMLTDNNVGESSLNTSLLELAEQGHSYYSEKSSVDPSRMVIIDFSKPSSEKRLYVVDIVNDRVLLETYVSHGKNSGNLMVKSVSNEVNSNQSSQGFFKIAEKYVGKHGESYRLDGLEHGINDNARKRAIVIHAAWYANEEIIEQQGRLGRSFGCPALPTNDYKKFQELVGPNALMFIYFPNEKYISSSSFIRSLTSS